MLEIINLSHNIQRRGADLLTVLDNTGFIAPGGHLLAVLGARLSGKSTLLRTIAGVLPVQSGAIVWAGRDLARQPLTPNEVAYVSAADDTLHGLLSARENVISAVLLRVSGIATRNAVSHADKILALCGIETLAAQRAATLTKPQRRRLSLAVAMVADPLLVICDDFTEGMDPKSERELGALLQTIAQENPKRVVINGTSTLANLGAYDSVVVLHEGRVCFHGPGRALTHYFSIPHTDDLYHRLAKRPSQRWQDSWNRHRDSYYDAFKLSIATSGGSATADHLEIAADDDEAAPAAKKESGKLRFNSSTAAQADSTASPLPPPLERPTLGKQLSVLMLRRWTTFRRDKTEIATHALMLFALPLLPLLCAWPHLDTLHAAQKPGATLLPEAALSLGHVVNMVLLLQVAVILFMAVRNGAREIAAERSIWQCEHQGGLRSSAYLTGKALFLGTLVIAQASWLWIFTDLVTGGLSGNTIVRLILLILTGAGFTSLSLGISALSSHAGQAAARCWQLAFIQLPLCGALLALPAALGTLIHPFITAYYGWSGQVDTLKGSLVFEPISQLTGSWFASPGVAIALLIAHLLVGLAMASWGLRRRV
jgi:ABC-type multidrug transport system ATPase subunit